MIHSVRRIMKKSFSLFFNQIVENRHQLWVEVCPGAAVYFCDNVFHLKSALIRAVRIHCVQAVCQGQDARPSGIWLPDNPFG